MDKWDWQRRDCACSVCAHGCISLILNALSVWLSQQSECVTVIWTAETCRVLMFAQPPTPICLQSHEKAQSKEKNIQAKCFPQAMIPVCLIAQKLRETHTLINNYKYVLLEGHVDVQTDISIGTRVPSTNTNWHTSTDRYTHSKNSNWNQESLSMILNQLWPVLERLHFSSMMLQAKQACVFSTLVLSDIYTLYYLTPAAVRCR